MKPIILNTEMVKAVLSGSKVCTRRSLKPQPVIGEDRLPDLDGYPWKPPYQKDDILYVRETWSQYAKGGGCLSYTAYKADYPYNENDDGEKITIEAEAFKWSPSIHMPKDLARILLKVTNVRVERLNDISDDDCLKEGIEVISNDPDEYFCRDYSKKRSIENWTFFNENERESFKTLWNSIYNNWDSNPWIWVIDFEVVNNGTK